MNTLINILLTYDNICVGGCTVFCSQVGLNVGECLEIFSDPVGLILPSPLKIQ